MLARRTEGSTWLGAISLSGSPASAISNDENGPSRVAALGFRIFRSFTTPTNGELVTGKGVVEAAVSGFIGVAGASCGGAVTVWFEEGAAGARLPTLRIAGSANG